MAQKRYNGTVITVRFESIEEKQKVDKIAAALNMSSSAYIREIVVERLKQDAEEAVRQVALRLGVFNPETEEVAEEQSKKNSTRTTMIHTPSNDAVVPEVAGRFSKSPLAQDIKCKRIKQIAQCA